MSATRLEPEALVADVGTGAAAAAWALARGGRTDSFGRARSGGAAAAPVATGEGAATVVIGAAGEHGMVTSVATAATAAAAAAATCSAGSGESQALGRDGDAAGDWVAAAAGELCCG